MRKIHGIRAKALRVSQLTVRNKFRHLITFFHFTKSQIPLSFVVIIVCCLFHFSYRIFYFFLLLPLLLSCIERASGGAERRSLFSVVSTSEFHNMCAPRGRIIRIGQRVRRTHDDDESCKIQRMEKILIQYILHALISSKVSISIQCVGSDTEMFAFRIKISNRKKHNNMQCELSKIKQRRMRVTADSVR